MKFRDAKAGEEVSGLPVRYWLSQKDAATLTGTSERSLRRHEGRGLPCRKRGRGKFYPVPHLLVWLRAWTQLEGTTGRGRISMARALQHHYGTLARLDEKHGDPG